MKKRSLYSGPIRNVSKAIRCYPSSVPSKSFSAVQCVAFPAFSVYQRHLVFGLPYMSVPNFFCIDQGSVSHTELQYNDFKRLAVSFPWYGLDFLVA